jgi:hypothetical protein
LETEPAKSQESTAPENSDEEPLEAVPTRDTTPPFSQASMDEETAAEYEPVTPDESLDHGDPDWSEPEGAASPSNGEGGKSVPEWAQTVHTDPGQAIPADLSAEIEQASSPSVESETQPEEQPAPEVPAVADTVPPRAEESQPPPIAAEADEVPTPSAPTEPPKAVAADAA